MTAAAAILIVALVAEDPAVLRNAPRDDAPAEASLSRGDWLEVRGEAVGFLRVYDHRRERAGYVRPTQVRVYQMDQAATAPDLAAVVRFLRDAPGLESLGIGHAALALRAAPAGADTSEILAAIGTMADRLARRASARKRDARDVTLAAHLEVAESYGVRFRIVDSGGFPARTSLCYDGDAWARVLAAPAASPVERARAALFLAGTSCRDPLEPPAQARTWNDERVGALEAVADLPASALPAALAGRVRLRLAEALAWRAFDEARRAGWEASARAEAAAIRQLALTDRGLLAPEDLDAYETVAVRVGATRWAAEAPLRPTAAASKRPVEIVAAPRAAGETCLRVLTRDAQKPRLLGERCTYGVVWQNAARWAPSGTVATIAVQPLPAWTELWVVRRSGDGASWTIDPLTPATMDPDAGYVEEAGFSPDGAKLLVVREARAPGHSLRRFQVLSVATLAVEKWAGSADKLAAFKHWSAPAWRGGTLALR